MEMILILENDTITATKLKNILYDKGYNNVIIAMNYYDAIYYIENKKIDFAFLDIDLNSKKSGIDVANKCLEISDFPYVFLTGYADDETIEIAKLTRPYGFIAKPFMEKDIISCLKVNLYNHKHRYIDSNRHQIINKNDQPIQVKKAIDYIHQNAKKNIKTETIANELGWTRSHLSKVFHKSLGYTLKEYLVRVKVETVCRYLSQNEHKLCDVAHQFGFDTYVTFVHSFKKIKGVTPKQYVANKVKFRPEINNRSYRF